MDHTQIFVLALANVPTMITVLIGILINNARIGDLNSRLASSETAVDRRLTSMENRMNAIETRLTNLDHKFDVRFDLLLNKVIEIDNRR